MDGAARIVDPIIAGFNTGEHIWVEISEGLPRDGLVKDNCGTKSINRRLALATC